MSTEERYDQKEEVYQIKYQAHNNTHQGIPLAQQLRNKRELFLKEEEARKIEEERAKEVQRLERIAAVRLRELQRAKQIKDDIIAECKEKYKDGYIIHTVEKWYPSVIINWNEVRNFILNCLTDQGFTVSDSTISMGNEQVQVGLNTEGYPIYEKGQVKYGTQYKVSWM